MAKERHKMNQYDNVSEADFVKWQEERQQMENVIKALTDRVCELHEDMIYWQRQALHGVSRG
jgi:hypothetical protein